MTTATHPAGPGFTAAFIEHDPGEPLTYQPYSAEVNPAGLFNGCLNTVEPYPIDIPALDAQLAADGYLRVGDWSWTEDIWGCAVRKIEAPGWIRIEIHDSGRPLTVTEAIQAAAGGTGPGITVTQVNGRGWPEFGTIAVLYPSANGARVQFGGMVDHSPWVARIYITCYQLATDIAEAATLIAAARPVTAAGTR